MREMRDPGCENKGVSPTPAQQAKAARLAAEIAARLADISFALPGTVADRMTRCGYANSSCTVPTTSGPARKTARPPPAS
jgi:hypothetical protein